MKVKNFVLGFVFILMIVSVIGVASAMPDLTIYQPNISIMNMNGTKLAFVSFKVKNVGDVTSGSSYASLSGIYNTQFSVPSLASGGSYQINKAYICSYSHNITITADNTNLVNESDEANNRYFGFVICN